MGGHVPDHNCGIDSISRLLWFPFLSRVEEEGGVAQEEEDADGSNLTRQVPAPSPVKPEEVIVRWTTFPSRNRSLPGIPRCGPNIAGRRED